MFKNLTLYRIANTPDLATLEQAAQAAPFTPCTPTQELSDGWIPPRGHAHGALVESVNGHWIMRYHSETKMLPASVIEKHVQEKCDAIERDQGRKPGRKERRDLKEEARTDLLPQAFTKERSIWVWIDPATDILGMDTCTQAQADNIATMLVEHTKGLELGLLDTNTGPNAAMAHWLLEHEAPAGFSIDQECELKAWDESKAVVRYGRHPLDIEEVRQHIHAGKLPTKLAMTWDDRVSFVLDAALHLHKIELLEVEAESKDADGFDADVAIFTGEMTKMLPALIESLGGKAGS